MNTLEKLSKDLLLANKSNALNILLQIKAELQSIKVWNTPCELSKKVSAAIKNCNRSNRTWLMAIKKVRFAIRENTRINIY